MKTPLWRNGSPDIREYTSGGAAPFSRKDFTPELIDFLQSVHGRVRRDDLEDYYYENVSTISLHLLLNSNLPAKEILWSWYDYFDREHSESIYQTLPPLKDEVFLSILEGCAFQWDPELIRNSGLIFLSRHRKEVYSALEEYLSERLECHRTMAESELRTFLTPHNTWSDAHLRKQALRLQTRPLSRAERLAVYRRFESNYLRATARQLMDEAATEGFWKSPPPELEALSARFAKLVGVLREEALRIGAYVSREAYEKEHWRHGREGGKRSRRRSGAGRTSRVSGRSALNDLFAVLGLTPAASVDDVKAAYREKVKQFHPDQGGSVKEFIQIQEAYEVLLTEVF